MKKLLNDNKVFIIGLLAALSLTLQEFVGKEDIQLTVLAWALFTAVLSYLANAWRGRGLSITGILGNLAAVFITIDNGGEFSWIQFALQATISIIAAASADPKSVGYERTDVIKEAKKEGETIVPAQLTKK